MRFFTVAASNFARLCAAAVLIITLFLVSAHLQAVTGQAVVTAPPDTVVTVPYGDWAQWLLLWAANPESIVWTLVGGIVAWLLAKLPGPAQIAFRTFRVEQMLKRAILYAINTTAGAAAGKVLTVDVGNEVIERAADYAIQSGTKGLNEWVGGELGWQKKVIARIELEAAAEANSPANPLPLRKAQSLEDRLTGAGR